MARSRTFGGRDSNSVLKWLVGRSETLKAMPFPNTTRLETTPDAEGVVVWAVVVSGMAVINANSETIINLFMNDLPKMNNNTDFYP